MKRLLSLLLFLSALPISSMAQNVGINQTTPLYPLHVTDLTGAGVSILGESNNPGNSGIYVHALNSTANAIFGYERSGFLRAYSGVNSNNDWFLNVGPALNNLYVKSSNDFVGINTSNPAERLHILSPSNTDTKIRVEATGISGSAGIQARGSSAATDVFEMTKYNASSAGSVAGVALANLSLLYAGIGAGPMLVDVITNNPMQFATGNTVRMTILGNGNTGINQTNPIVSLHVGDVVGNGVPIMGESSNAGNASIYINALGAAANAGFGYERSSTLRAYSGVNNNNDWFLNVGISSNNLYVKSSNDFVGINTSNPGERLHILSPSNTDTKIRVEAVGISGSAGIQARGSSGATDVFEMTKYNASAAGSIAGVPLANLSLLYAGAGANRMFLDVITNNIMQFGTNNIVRMTIAGDGSVGVGITTPGRLLDVNGDARIGVNGTTITNIIKTTVTSDIPSIIANGSITHTISVTNAVVGSTVLVSPANALPNGLAISYARVSAAGTVEIGLTNNSPVPVDPPSMSFFITIIQ